MKIEEEVARLAGEASSVVQDERGLSARERALFEDGWARGFQQALPAKTREEARAIAEPDYEIAEVRRQRAHDLLRSADMDLVNADHGVPSVILATSTRALAYLKRAEIELALARENE